MKKKTEHDVGAAENSAVPVVSTLATPPSAESAIEPMGVDAIRSRILTVRGVQVMLAPDLADLYQVETRSFNQAVKRNIKRFPENFRFQLTKAELDEVITNCDNPDTAVLIHVGATLNHLGKRCFAFSSMDKSNIPDIVAKI